MGNDITYLPLTEAYSVPSGQVHMLLNKWWIYHPDRGLIFVGEYPQCNSDKATAEMVRARYYPEAELLFVKQVTLPYTPGSVK